MFNLTLISGMLFVVCCSGCISANSPSGVNLARVKQTLARADAGDVDAMYNAAHYLTEDAYALAVRAMNYARKAVEAGDLPAKKRELTAKRMCDAYFKSHGCPNREQGEETECQTDTRKVGSPRGNGRAESRRLTPTICAIRSPA